MRPKDCPFCGGFDTEVETTENNDTEYVHRVCCLDCGCRTDSFKDALDAVKAWNNRAK
jgi:Lar family restriction alleviation protein